MGKVLRAEVTEAPIALGDLLDELDEAAAGAVVGFSGVVRDHDRGRGVVSLEYQAHPSAGRVLQRVAEELLVDEPAVLGISVVHRVGALAVGDAALVCAVSGAHRQEAHRACGELVERVKAHLPVWKHQLFSDGEQEWVNCP